MTDGLHIVQHLLKTGAVTRWDLEQALAASPTHEAAPSHRDYLTVVQDRCPPKSLSTYATTFRRLAAAYESRSVAEVTPSDLAGLARSIREASADRAGSGVGAERGFIHAARFFYRCAVDDRYRAENPASSLPMPRRPTRVRRALTDAELLDLYRTVAAHSRDPLLDLLLLDLHRETAARRGGAINLRLTDLNPKRPSILLREKGDHEREIPASRSLLSRIEALAHERNVEGAYALGYTNGNRLTRRRYNSLFERVQKELPWAKRLGISIHWLRHTTLTDISQATNGRIAAAYAGHYDRTVTDRYTVPTFDDLAIAHDLVFPHHRVMEPAPDREGSHTWQSQPPD